MVKTNAIQTFIDTQSVCDLSDALQLPLLNREDPGQAAAYKFWEAILGVCAFGDFTPEQKTSYVANIARIATSWGMLKNPEYGIFAGKDLWDAALGKFEHARAQKGDDRNVKAVTEAADALESYTTHALQEIGVLAKPPKSLEDIVISTIGSAGTGVDLMDKSKETAQQDHLQVVPGPEIKYRSPTLANMRREAERRTQPTHQTPTDEELAKMTQAENRDTAFGRAYRLLEDLPRDANKFESVLIECLNRTTFDMDAFDYIDRIITSELCGLPALDHALDGYNPWTAPERNDRQRRGLFVAAVQNIGQDGLTMYARKSIDCPNNWTMEEIEGCLRSQIAGAAERINDLQLPEPTTRQIRDMLFAIDTSVAKGRIALSMFELKAFFIIERLLELANASMYMRMHPRLMFRTIGVVYSTYNEFKMRQASERRSYGRAQPYGFGGGQFYGGYPHHPQMGPSVPESLCGGSAHMDLVAVINEIYQRTGLRPAGLVYAPHSKQSLRIVMLGDPGLVDAFIQEPPLAQRHR